MRNDERNRLPPLDELHELQAQVAALKLEMTSSHSHGKGRK
jgi:hypothetical protein